MGSLRCADRQTRPTEVLELTRLTVEECQPLVPHVEIAFQAHMAHGRLDGQPRPARRYTPDTNWPWPTPEDRLLCLRVDWNTYPLQVVQGRRFGRGHRTAPQWIHVRFVVRQATLRRLGDAPSRSLTELAQRLGVAAATAAAGVGSPTTSALPVTAPAPALASPLAGTRGRHDASRAPRIRLRNRAVIAARKQTLR